MSYGTPPPPPPPQQPYGSPYGGLPQQPRTSGLAIGSLVCGIVGFFCCTFFAVSIAAIVLGVLARNEIKRSNGLKTGGPMAMIGLILGIVSIVIGVVYWILVISGAIGDGFSYHYSTSS